jgi:hypothetical protein
MVLLLSTCTKSSESLVSPSVRQVAHSHPRRVNSSGACLELACPSCVPGQKAEPCDEQHRSEEIRGDEQHRSPAPAEVVQGAVNVKK